VAALNLSASAKTTDADDSPAVDAAPAHWRPTLRDLLPVAMGGLVVVALSLAWLQVLHPYLEHDDWDFLLPVTTARADAMHARLLNEGRWLNYWWWLGPGHLFSTVGASLLYFAAYIAFVARIAWRWAPGWLSLPVVVALFASPMPAEASFWPSTLGLSMVIAALAAWTLPLCVERNRTLSPWIVAVVVLSFFAYPPVTLVLFLVLVVELIDASWKRLTGAVVLFCLSYVAATAGVFALNERAFGKFGIEVRPWRRPNPIHDLHDLWVNIKRYLLQMDHLVHATALPIVLGLCASAVCLAVPDLRRRAVRLMLAVVVVAGIGASPTILDGVLTAYRGSWWVWFPTLVPLVWLARAKGSPRLRDRSVASPPVLRMAAVLALVASGLSGIQVWRSAIHYNQHRFALYSSVERQLGHAIAQHPSDRVYIYGDADNWTQFVFTQEAQYLSMRASYMYGITVANCHPPACNVAERPAVAAQIQRGVQVIHTAGVILVVPPSRVHPQPDYS
jgi:hypothetical protein